MNIVLKNGKTANVTIQSQLIPVDQIKPETIDAIRNACVSAAVAKATDMWGPAQRLTVRDLNASDLSYTANIFTEVSNATTNAWNAMAQAAFTVATGAVLGIYGINLSCTPEGTDDFLPISGIRIDVGGARVAQWSTQCIDFFNSAASLAPYNGRSAVTKSPIIIAQDITVTFYEYTRTASRTYTPCWLGVTIEKEGITLKP